MEFNPLDLLASAAELQQKQDDDPHVTMVTRRNNSVNTKASSAEVLQKENTEVVNNNNNNNCIKSKGITIIKKIKIGGSTPEIEKMLNEHNYGNAKRNPRFDNNAESGSDVNNRYQDSHTISGSRCFSIETKPSHMITTFGRNKDNVVAISNSSSQAGDSECKCGANSSTVKGLNSYAVCKCRANHVDKNSVQSSCSKCINSECDCSMPTGEHGMVDSQISDKTGGQLMDSPSVKQECENKHVDRNSTQGTQSGECPKSQNTLKCTNTCDMDTKTDLSQNEKSENNIKNTCTIEFENKKSETDDCEPSEIAQSDGGKQLEAIDVKKSSSDMVKCSVFTSDMTRIKQETNLAMSDRKKLPYVKVIPVKSSSELDTHQTLVINITSNPCNINGKILQNGSDSLLETDRLKSEKCEERNKSNSDIGIIKSLIVTDKVSSPVRGSGDTVKSLISKTGPIKPRLDISKCDTFDLSEKSDTYDSLKRLELNDSLCSEISSTSVHLLSPDRRNPDSMGIAESPVMTTQHDLLGLSELDGEFDKNKTDLNCESKKCLPEFNQSLLSSQENENCLDLGVISKETNNCKSVTNTTQLESSCSESSGDVKELVRDSRLTSGSQDKLDFTYNSANDHSSGSGNDVPIFRFESDHCYAGIPRGGAGSQSSLENEEQSFSERDEVKTPMDSLGEISQDSGYEDVTQSPDADVAMPVTPEIAPGSGLKTVKNLVPVLISVNNTGCLTLHSDPNISKHLGGQVLTVTDNGSLDKGSLKFLPGTNLTSIPQTPLILSPVRNQSPVAQREPPPLVQTNAESILGLLRPTSPDPYYSTAQEQTSPPKFGKFRIGTFASFSNNSMGMDSTTASLPLKLTSQIPGKLPSSSVSRVRTNGVKSPPAVLDTLGTLVQKVKSSLSPALQIDNRSTDHIQHDHDYCLKSLVPSLVSSVLEAKLQKEATVKGKLPHGKIKKSSDIEVVRPEGKLGKRKRCYSNMSKEDYNEECEIEEDSEGYSQPEFIRPKTRAEKYIEQKSAEPKVKITGSSGFQDQFVYFMNTKKRSRRRESRDTPMPGSVDRRFVPPKPGDIVVPHLSDQDIENLKKRSRLRLRNIQGLNSLQKEFMAAKFGNSSFGSQSQPPSETAAVDEKNIINTILSMENESLSQPDEPYNESMELYGQGLGTDIMNFLPEQMNLTQEQMDLLYSAVDEVQNQSPGLVDDKKLVATDGGETAFGQFAIPNTFAERRSSNASSVETNEEEITDKREAKSPVSSEETTERTAKKETAEAASPVETIGTRPLEPVAADSVDNKSCPSSPFLATPDKDDISGKPNEDKSTVPFSVDAPAPSSAVLSVPQSEASLSIDTNLPTLSTKASFDSVSVNDNVENCLKPSINSVNITNPLNSDMSALTALDKSSLDLLGGEFRLDKSDLFSEPGVSVPGPGDTSAPWIVTVSMYWNDLPAIMINNQPYVRLVDIHKQILPAKDTGILKKRCQLMGIPVENCSEMQRYFLVQYGRAFNSKSTLIVMKDNAKGLIGYYVDPQPKSARIDDHKSIIDHRREQLRRIALARRAAIRARKVQGRKEEDDPRAIKHDAEMEQPSGGTSIPSVFEPTKPSEALTTVVPPITATHTDRASVSVPNKRATRHKKINFLEMLRGDSTSQVGEDEGGVQDEAKKAKTLRQESTESNGSAKKGRALKNKVKIVNVPVKYTIQSESSETESNYTDSELSSSEYMSELEVVPVIGKKNSKHRIITIDSKSKSKAKMNLLKKQQRPALKVKIGSGGKRSKLLGGSGAPVAVQVVNRTLSPALPFSRSRLGSSDSRDSTSPLGLETPSGSYQIYGKSNGQNRQLTFGKPSEISSEDTHNNTYNIPSSFSNFESNLYSKQNIPEFKKVIVEQINESDMKIPTTLPDEILEEESKTREMETNTDFDVTGPDSSEEKSVDVTELNCHQSLPETSNGIQDSYNESIHDKNITENNVTLSVVDSSSSRKERTFSSESLELTNEDSCSSPVVTDKLLLIMKREREQINNQEAPLRILHRESSPLNVNRSRSQLGELFIEKYMTKKSPCVRCYTCRKVMTVDGFMRHLHDMITGGLLGVNTPRTIDASDPEMSDGDRKVWEAFQRKKELFDNNQLPSNDVQDRIFTVDSDSNHSLENMSPGIKPSGPRVITTPVSPVQQIQQAKSSVHAVHARRASHPIPESADGVRSSGRKRKKKQLYPFEEYTFAKFPRLHGVDGIKDSTSESQQ